ncbi:hypothetical protein [Actinoplanes sp. NPDC049118]|uniref:hypothetical protein n=1 Tax=Actinoplanes sp. NPDC049118 TaxID=3155769 RepID=UPI00340078B5
MRRKTIILLLAATGLIVAAGPADAAPMATATGTRPAGEDCGAVRLTSDLPAPPVGRSARQTVTIGANCQVVRGPVEFVSTPAVNALDATATYHTSSEMYDCCRILMTALYTDSTVSTAGGLVTGSSTTISTRHNREPWNAGWSVASTSNKGGCPAECAAASHTGHAEFSYRGIFDPTGHYYANIHDTSVVLNGDGSATCTETVDLRHSFIGWNWQHTCA